MCVFDFETRSVAENMSIYKILMTHDCIQILKCAQHCYIYIYLLVIIVSMVHREAFMPIHRKISPCYAIWNYGYEIQASRSVYAYN